MIACAAIAAVRRTFVPHGSQMRAPLRRSDAMRAKQRGHLSKSKGPDVIGQGVRGKVRSWVALDDGCRFDHRASTDWVTISGQGSLIAFDRVAVTRSIFRIRAVADLMHDHPPADDAADKVSPRPSWAATLQRTVGADGVLRGHQDAVAVDDGSSPRLALIEPPSQTCSPVSRLKPRRCSPWPPGSGPRSRRPGRRASRPGSATAGRRVLVSTATISSPSR